MRWMRRPPRDEGDEAAREAAFRRRIDELV